MCEGRKWWFEEAIKATILSHHFFPPEPSSLFQLRHFVLIFKAKTSSEARVVLPILYTIPVTRINQDQLHSVIQFALDRAAKLLKFIWTI